MFLTALLCLKFCLTGIAKTGSGKTLAFLLPMFRHILDQAPLEETDGPITIIMTPTRELCMQIGKDIKKFSKGLGLHAVCVYGGTGISEQIAELKRGEYIDFLNNCKKFLENKIIMPFFCNFSSVGQIFHQFQID